MGRPSSRLVDLRNQARATRASLRFLTKKNLVPPGYCGKSATNGYGGPSDASTRLENKPAIAIHRPGTDRGKRCRRVVLWGGAAILAAVLAARCSALKVVPVVAGLTLMARLGC